MSPIILFLTSLASLSLAWTGPGNVPKDTPSAVETVEPDVAAVETQPDAADDAKNSATVAAEATAAVQEAEPEIIAAVEPQMVEARCQHAAPPICAVQAGGFSDNDLATSCRTELQAYIGNIQDYSSCRRDVLREIGEQTRQELAVVQDEARRATQLFNCRLSGDTNCN